MVITKKQKLSLEKLLEQSLVKEEDRPFEVPRNWVWTKIDSINNFTSRSIDPEKTSSQMFELYSVPSSEDNYPEIISGNKIGSTKQKVSKGDVLLCKINPRINRVWMVFQHTEYEQIASSEWIVIRNDNINSKYLMWCLKSKYFREYLLSNVSGVGGSLMRAQPKFVKEYPVPIPPLAEQQRIVDVIESLFKKLDTAKELVQNALDSFENRKAAILHQAFTGQLTAKWRDKNGVELDEWRETSLSTVVTGFKYGVSEKSDTLYKGIPVIRIPNVISNQIDFTDMKYLDRSDISEENQIKESDILIIRSNGSRDLVGKCALVGRLDKPYTFASYLIRIRPKNIEPRYLMQLLNSSYVRKQLFDKSKSSAGINNINSKELGSVQIPLPRLTEQQEIVRILDNLLENEQRAKELCDIIEKVDLMKKSILVRAFRGELGTNDSKEESAIELLKKVLAEKV